MTRPHPIFLDAQSTTPMDPRVFEAMRPYFMERFGHPASRSHAFGWEAEAAVERAREQIGRLVGARESREIVFTSGGTEAINLALKGVAETHRGPGGHIVTTSIEQRAGLDVARRLEREGFGVTWLPVDADGLVDPEAVERALTSRTILISVMLANNEIGTIQDVAAIGRLARDRGIPFHADATHAAGRIPVDVEAMGIDLLSCTAHLMHGPKGVGALYVRRRHGRSLVPLIDGGGHERGMRGGTLPVPLVAGFGRAAEICGEVMGEEGARLRALRDRLQHRILSRIAGTHLNGHPERRLPHNLNLSFDGVEGEAVLLGLNRDVAASSGSACTSATLEPSYVIVALGASTERAHASIRFSLHRFTTEAEVDEAARCTTEVVSRLRQVSPRWEATAR